jgi:hypothetical protein
MESSAISVHQLKICAFALGEADWFSTKEAALAANTAARTTRRHLTRLFELGILERRKLFEGWRWRRRDARTYDARAKAYYQRLDELLKTYEKERGTFRTTLASFAMMFV